MCVLLETKLAEVWIRPVSPLHGFCPLCVSCGTVEHFQSAVLSQTRTTPWTGSEHRAAHRSSAAQPRNVSPEISPMLCLSAAAVEVPDPPSVRSRVSGSPGPSSLNPVSNFPRLSVVALPVRTGAETEQRRNRVKVCWSCRSVRCVHRLSSALPLPVRPAGRGFPVTVLPLPSALSSGGPQLAKRIWTQQVWILLDGAEVQTL